MLHTTRIVYNPHGEGQNLEPTHPHPLDISLDESKTQPTTSFKGDILFAIIVHLRST